MNKLIKGMIGLTLSLRMYGQTSAIDQLRADLMVPGGCTVEIPGLWATTQMVTEQPSEIRIVDGRIVRGKAAILHGQLNVPIQVGQTLRVVTVAAPDDAKNDLLRISVQAAGIVVPLTFVFPKGSLASMPMPQLEATVERALRPPTPPINRQPVASVAKVLPSTSSQPQTTVAANDEPPPFQQPVQTPSDTTAVAHIWQLSTIAYGNAATTGGSGSSSFGSSKVQFIVSCTSTGFLSSTLVIPETLMPYTVNEYSNAAVDDLKLGRLQILNGPVIQLPLDGNAGDDSPHRLRLNGEPKSLYSTDLAGKAVKITLMPPPGKQGGPIVLRFIFPSDPKPLLSVSQPCLKTPTSKKSSR